MKINCDIGERGIDNLIDLALMKLIDIANIACGGHAGDFASVNFFCDLAKKNDVLVSAHLSYPDKNNFGRLSMDISKRQLLKALDDQYLLMPHVKTVKFHGALYNDLNKNVELANWVFEWLKINEIELLLSPQNSVLANLCNGVIRIMPEVFAERAYIYENDQFLLMPRNRQEAILHKIEDAIKHSQELLSGYVYTHEANGEKLYREIYGETICIHSDAVIALELAQKLRDIIA
jgi:UPF0271 protein